MPKKSFNKKPEDFEPNTKSLENMPSGLDASSRCGHCFVPSLEEENQFINQFQSDMSVVQTAPPPLEEPSFMFDVACKSFDSASVKVVLLPKFILNPSAKHITAAEKSLVVIVFKNDVRPRNIYKDLLVALRDGLENFKIVFHEGDKREPLFEFQLLKPRIHAIDFGHLKKEGNSDITIEIDYDGIVIDNEEFSCP